VYRGTKAHILSQRCKVSFTHVIHTRCNIHISLSSSPVPSCCRFRASGIKCGRQQSLKTRAMSCLYCQVLHSCCTHKMSVAVQKPVVTLAWLCGYHQLLAPLISLSIDTKPFCQSPLRFKPMLIISLVFTFCVYFTILVRTEQFVNPLNFYNFSQSFRLQFAGLTMGGVIFYATFIHAFRLVMNRYEQRRLSPL